MNFEFKHKPNSVTYRDKELIKITKEQVSDKFDYLINNELLLFWNIYEHILFDNGISIYGFDLAVERNIQYEIETYLKDYVLIGDDGSGQGIYINKSDSRLTLYYLDLGAIGSIDLYHIDKNFFTWLKEDLSLEDNELESNEDELLFENANLYIVSGLVSSEDKTKLIFTLRKELELSESLATISKGIDDKKDYMIKSSFIPYKYFKSIKDLQARYGCLKLISANNKEQISL